MIAPVTGLAQHRYGEARTVELSGEVDVDCAPPVGRRNFVNAPGGSGNAGIVDEHVEPGELAIHLGKKACDVVLVGDVGEGSRNVRRGGQTFVEHALRYVTDVDARTGPGKR